MQLSRAATTTTAAASLRQPDVLVEFLDPAPQLVDYAAQVGTLRNLVPQILAELLDDRALQLLHPALQLEPRRALGLQLIAELLELRVHGHNRLIYRLGRDSIDCFLERGPQEANLGE